MAKEGKNSQKCVGNANSGDTQTDRSHEDKRVNETVAVIKETGSFLKDIPTSSEDDEKEKKEATEIKAGLSNLVKPSTEDDEKEKKEATEIKAGLSNLVKPSTEDDEKEKKAVAEKGVSNLVKPYTSVEEDDVKEETTGKSNLFQCTSTSNEKDDVEEKTNISTSTKTAKALEDDNAKSVAFVTKSNVCKSSVNHSVKPDNTKKQKVDNSSTLTTTKDRGQ